MKIKKIIISIITFLDLFISILRYKSSKLVRYSVINKLSKIDLMNQDFIAQTFLEENRVIKRFKIEKDLKLFLITELSKDTNFWDIGGCVGNFGIYAAHTGSKVLIFEPDGLTYSSLLRNVFNSNL